MRNCPTWSPKLPDNRYPDNPGDWRSAIDELAIDRLHRKPTPIVVKVLVDKKDVDAYAELMLRNKRTRLLISKILKVLSLLLFFVSVFILVYLVVGNLEALQKVTHLVLWMMGL